MKNEICLTALLLILGVKGQSQESIKNDTINIGASFVFIVNSESVDSEELVEVVKFTKDGKTNVIRTTPEKAKSLEIRKKDEDSYIQNPDNPDEFICIIPR